MSSSLRSSAQSLVDKIRLHKGTEASLQQSIAARLVTSHCDTPAPVFIANIRSLLCDSQKSAVDRAEKLLGRCQKRTASRSPSPKACAVPNARAASRSPAPKPKARAASVSKCVAACQAAAPKARAASRSPAPAPKVKCVSPPKPVAKACAVPAPKPKAKARAASPAACVVPAPKPKAKARAASPSKSRSARRQLQTAVASAPVGVCPVPMKKQAVKKAAACQLPVSVKSASPKKQRSASVCSASVAAPVSQRQARRSGSPLTLANLVQHTRHTGSPSAHSGPMSVVSASVAKTVARAPTVTREQALASVRHLSRAASPAKSAVSQASAAVQSAKRAAKDFTLLRKDASQAIQHGRRAGRATSQAAGSIGALTVSDLMSVVSSM